MKKIVAALVFIVAVFVACNNPNDGDPIGGLTKLIQVSIDGEPVGDLTLDKNAFVQKVDVESNTEWSIVSPNVNWIDVEQINDSTLQISVLENDSSDERQFEVKLQSGEEYSIEFLVVQTTEDEGGDISFTLTDGTEILSKKNLDYILGCTDVDGIISIRYSAQTPPDALPTLNEKIVINRAFEPDYPDGIIAMVFNIENSGEEKIVNCLPLTLGQVFEELDIEEQNIDIGGNVTRIEDEDGNELPFAKTRSIATSKFEIELEKSIKLGSGVSVTPKLNLAVGMKFQAIVHDGDIEKMTIYIDPTIKFTTQFALSVETPEYSAEDKLLARVFFAPVPVGPIVVVPQMRIYFTISAQGKASMKASVSYESKTRAGISYELGEYYTIFRDMSGVGEDPEKEKSPLEFDSELEAEMSISAGPKTSVGLRLYGNAVVSNIGVKSTFNLNAKAKLGADYLLNPSIFWYSALSDMVIETEFEFIPFTDLSMFGMPIADSETEYLSLKVPFSATYFYPEVVSAAGVITERGTEIQLKYKNNPFFDNRYFVRIINPQGNIVMETLDLLPEKKFSEVENNDEVITASALFRPAEDVFYGDIYAQFYVMIGDEEVLMSEQHITIEDADLRAGLMRFYNSAGGSSWTRNDNWGSDKPISQWYGVESSGGFLTLNLGNNNLSGNINLNDIKTLHTIYCDDNNISSIVADEHLRLNKVWCSNNLLSKVEFKDCNSLEYLSVARIPVVETFNISGCHKIKSFIDITGSKIDKIDISNCSSLKSFGCFDVGVTSLNVTGCSDLEYINCSENKLSEIQGLSSCVELKGLDCYNNLIENLSLRDFKNLKSLGLGVSDDEVLKELDLSGCESLGYIYLPPSLEVLNITGCDSLTGLRVEQIEDGVSSELTEIIGLSTCRELKDVYIVNSKITEFNVSGCSKLQIATLHNNHLENVDFSNCTSLTKILALQNQSNGDGLLSVNVSGCTVLEGLYCNNNSVTNLDVSGCDSMKYIDCSYNQLEEIKGLGSCSSLEDIKANDNNISSIDLSSFSNLKQLVCDNNKITSLAVNHLSELTTLQAQNNLLTSINISDCVKLDGSEYGKFIFLGGNELRNITLNNIQHSYLVDRLHFEKNNLELNEYVKLWGDLDWDLSNDSYDHFTTDIWDCEFSEYPKVTIIDLPE